jgi:colanic acid biosynthesis glycosyl transferase WcaI
MTGKLKLLVLGLNYAPEPVGVARYTTGMARMLAGAGHTVHVITGFPHYPEWRIAEGYSGRRIEEMDGAVRVTRVRHPVPVRPTGAGRITMEAVFALHAATVPTPRPDVVIAVSPALLTVAAGLVRWRWHDRSALGVVIQDLYGKAIAETGALGGRGARAVRRLELTLLARANSVAVIHHAFRRSLIHMGIEPSKITVIRNWTHTSPAAGDTAAMRTALGWPEGGTIALHAGNMGAKQGLENIVEAARLADERGLPITFVLMGAGHQRSHLTDMARGIRSIRFVAPLPDGEFETAVAAADVLVLNERPEVAEMCVPSKLTSYFAAGRPVIAATRGDSPAAQEVDAAGAGLVLPPGEPRLLLEAALAMGRDTAQADALGRNGRLYASTVYAESTARCDYLAWVRNLADPGNPA